MITETVFEMKLCVRMCVRGMGGGGGGGSMHACVCPITALWD